MMKYTHFVGIDISKATLDFSVIIEGEEVFHTQLSNSQKGLNQFLVKLITECPNVDLKDVLFCAEHTGIYTEKLLEFNDSYPINLWVESSLRIKKSMGLTRGKNDRIDAKRIGLFAFRFQDRVTIWTPERRELKLLNHLISLRDRVVKTVGSITKPLNELSDFMSNEDFERISNLQVSSLKGLEEDLSKIDSEIEKLIKEDEKLSYLFSIVSSVDNIGKITSYRIIATTNEFKTISEGKKYACYSGVVPFDHSSGTSVHKLPRVSHMANKTIKTTLHMCAMSAISRQGEFRDYYLRKIEEGKNKMSVLNAVRNKLVLRVFACVRDGKLYNKNFEYK